GLAAAVVLLLAATPFTGAASSTTLLPAAALLVVLVRYGTHPLERFAPLLAGLLILLLETAFGAGAARGALAGVLLAAATLPGRLWKVEAALTADRLAWLDDILVQARRGQRGEAPSAAEDLAELGRALGSVAGRVGARQVLLWDVEPHEGTARVRAAARGRGGRSVRLGGDPLGWVWDQGIRMRLDPAPHWAANGSITIADRLRRRAVDG